MMTYQTVNTQAPQAGSNLQDLTKWMQDRWSLGAHNYDKLWQSQGQAAQGAAQDAMSNYNTAVQGMQGLFGNLTQQANQLGQQGQQQANQAFDWFNNAMQYYNPQQQMQNIQTGAVPDMTRQNLQAIRDQQMANVTSDLDKSYGIQQRMLQDNLGARGVLNSQVAANALAQMQAEKSRQLGQSANLYDTQMAQELINTPYRQMEAAIQNLGAQSGAAQGLSGVANNYMNSMLNNYQLQGNLGAQVPQALLNQYSMAKGLYDIPAAMREQYMQPLQNLWQSLLDSSTHLESARIASDAADQNRSDSDWLTGIGSLVGAIGGLF